jgi:hypothetical protein
MVTVKKEDRELAKRLTDEELAADAFLGATTVLSPPYDEFIVHRAYGIARQRERNEKLRARRKRARDRKAIERLIDTIHKLRADWASAGQRMFLGIPDTWMDPPGPKYRCPTGHVSRFIIKSDKGDRCPACGSFVVMTFPADADGPLNLALGQPPTG